jgi:hypothetical protein
MLSLAMISMISNNHGLHTNWSSTNVTVLDWIMTSEAGKQLHFIVECPLASIIGVELNSGSSGKSDMSFHRKQRRA